MVAPSCDPRLTEICQFRTPSQLYYSNWTFQSQNQNLNSLANAQFDTTKTCVRVRSNNNGQGGQLGELMGVQVDAISSPTFWLPAGNIDLVTNPKRMVYCHMGVHPTVVNDVPSISYGHGYCVYLLSGGSLTQNRRGWVIANKEDGAILNSAASGAYTIRADYSASEHDGSPAFTIDNGTFDGTDVNAFAYVYGNQGNQNNREFYAMCAGYTDGGLLVSGEVGNKATFEDFYLVFQNPPGGEYDTNIIAKIGNLYTCKVPIEIGDGLTETHFEDENIIFRFFDNVKDKTITTPRKVHAPDNFLGLELNLTSTSSFILKSSTINSGEKYHFKTGPDTGATITLDKVNFEKTGVLELNNDSILTNCNFTSCGKMVISGASLTDCNIFSPIDGIACVISTLSTLSNVSFSTDIAADHAIQITSAGSYTFNSIFFSGFTEDIDITATTGTVTINIAGGDTPTYTTAGATVVIVAGANLTFSGLIPGSEVRVYLGNIPATSIEIDGVESSGTSFTMTQSNAGQNGFVVIHSLAFLNIRLPITFASQDTVIPIQQKADRQYLNP